MSILEPRNRFKPYVGQQKLFTYVLVTVHCVKTKFQVQLFQMIDYIIPTVNVINPVYVIRMNRNVTSVGLGYRVQTSAIDLST